MVQLADALGWGVVVLHDAKGMFPEDHPAFLGTYSPYYTDPVSVKQCYEAADAILFIGELLLVTQDAGGLARVYYKTHKSCLFNLLWVSTIPPTWPPCLKHHCLKE